MKNFEKFMDIFANYVLTASVLVILAIVIGLVMENFRVFTNCVYGIFLFIFSGFVVYESGAYIVRKLKFIKYNLSILATWFKYVFLKIPIKLEVIEFLEKHYKSTDREKKLIDKIKKINNQEPDCKDNCYNKYVNRTRT